MTSIIIPAHNEGAVIERCLRALTDGVDGDGRDDLEIVVVCNGCTDDTAARARAFDFPMTIIETDVASKINALNLGDSAAAHFPRIYVDGDLELSHESVLRLVEALSGGKLGLVSPRMDIDLSNRSWSMRAYYDIWTRLPYYKHKIGGVYAMSKAGRARFGDWPDLIADDTFVSVLFDPDEQAVIQEASFVMVPPTSVSALSHIESRRHAGAGELDEKYPEVMSTRRAAQRAALIRLFAWPWLWPQLAVFLYVKVSARRERSRQRASGQSKAWNRDESSRGG